jgi:hypothetical protein
MNNVKVGCFTGKDDDPNQTLTQLSRQTGSRNLTGPKTLPTIWYN